jgi:hypothetical protein
MQLARLYRLPEHIAVVAHRQRSPPGKSRVGSWIIRLAVIPIQ